MAPSVFKRRRQADSSDVDEDGDATYGSPPKRQNTRGGRTDSKSSPRGEGRGGANARGGRSASSSTRTTPNSSPSKTKRGGLAQAKESAKPIYSFFNSSVLKAKPAEAPIHKKKGTVVDDIQDDSDDASSSRPVSTATLTGSTVVSSNGNDAGHTTRLDSKRSPAFHPSQGFAGTSSSSTLADTDETRPWSERFAPATLDELAVHKKKVADVRAWLDGVYSGHDRKRLLVLKGPAGSGKTATVALLAKELGLELLEWRNPSGAEVSSDGYVSASAQFEEFLFRGRKYGSLDFDDGPPTPRVESEDVNRKRLIVVEEFPNTFNRSSSVLKAFQNTLKLFLASNTPTARTMFSPTVPQEAIIPLVLIVSETLLTTTSAAADSFTAHRLLGPEILSHHGASLVNFNPVAATILAKALELVIKKESQASGRKTTPSRMIWEKLGEVGDIRSALSSLEFMMLRGDDGQNWSGRVKPVNSKKRARDDAPLTNVEKESLEMITQREASLGMFHAIGKIVWNKRYAADAEKALSPVPPPSHLKHCERATASTVQVNDLIDEIGTSTQIFLSALHENCLLSCNCPQSTCDSIEAFNGCIDALSDSDLLAPNWDGGFGSGGMGGGFGRGTFQGAAQDSLRQDEVSFQVACRGILFALPSAVKRVAPPAMVTTSTSRWSRPSGGKPDAFKMFYPMGLRLWRVQEEIESLIDVWVGKILQGLHLPPLRSWRKTTPQKPMQAWRSPNKPAPAPPKLNPSAPTFVPTVPKLDPSAPSFDPTSTANIPIIHRHEALLERLPYLYQLHSRSHNPHGPASRALRELEKISLLRGVSVATLTEDIPSDEEDLQPSMAAWSTDKPLEPGATPKKGEKWRVFNKGIKKEESLEELASAGSAEKKGWLSDDDIMD